MQIRKVPLILGDFIIVSEILKHFSSRMLLCGWHIERNFLSGVAKKHKETYDKILDLPFVTCEKKFEEKIQKIWDSSKLSEQEKYLREELKTKYKWAKCYTKSSFCAGVYTTSRVDGLHSVLKKHLNSNSNPSLKKLFNCFHELETLQLQRFEEEYHRHPKKSGLFYSNPLKDIKTSCTEYIYHKIVPKFSKALNYVLEPFGNIKNSWLSNLILKFINLNRKVYIPDKKQKAHIIKLQNAILLCDCQESVFEGIPCRHELCVYVKGGKSIETLNFNKKMGKRIF